MAAPARLTDGVRTSSAPRRLGGVLADTPLVVLRLYEVAQVLGTMFGGYLVVRFGRTRFLAGLYAGCISIFFWDWIFTDHWFFNLTYDARSINLFTLAGRPEPLWSPCSYATFFGITTLLILRYRARLDRRLGRWQYVLLPTFFVALDVSVEGLTIYGLDIYRYGYRPEWLIFGVPYPNLIWVNIILLIMAWMARGVVRMQHERGVFAVAGQPAPVPTVERATAGVGGPAPIASAEIGPSATASAPEPWTLFAIGFAICPTAFYIGVGVMSFVLEVLQPWS